MSDSTPRAPDSALIAELRDALARRFADEIAQRVPQAVDLLEQQLAAASQREQWKPLRGAIALLGAARAALANRIAGEVAKRFDAKLQPGDDVFGKTARFSLDALSLVADDEVREEIAIGNTAKRLREQLGEELFALTQRLAALLGSEGLPDERNPAFPRILARGLYDALAEPGAESSTRLAAFTAFGPAMLEVVRGVYQEANRMLVARGVLPDFKRTYGTPVQTPARGAAAAPAAAVPLPTQGASAAASGASVAASGASAGASMRGASEGAPMRGAGPAPATALERLLATAMSRGASSGPLTIGAAATMPAASPGMVTIQVRPELLDALRTLEARLPALSAEDVAGESAVEAGPSVQIQRAKRAMAGTLTPSDAIVADVVAALFDRLFADRRLADASKAEVGRLQLPVLKAVLKDHAFFSDGKHPIRQLIDTIAELGACDPAVRVDECSAEEWIAASVQNIVDLHDDDPAVYARERERLAGVLERHHEAALEADPEVLALREQERGLVAMREATLAIAHRAGATGASEEAASFLYRSWRDVMVGDHLAGGEASAEWSQDLRLVDDILWVLVPRASSEERSRLVALLPDLIYRMKLGYLRAGIAAEAAAARVEELRVMLDEVVRAPAAAAHGVRRKAAPVPQASDDYTATLHSSGAAADEGLARGAWIEFRDPDAPPRRCRLTWMSPVQGACVFKDLDRNQSFAIALDELRERRRAGSAVLVEGPGVADASVDAALADVALSLDTQDRTSPLPS